MEHYTGQEAYQLLDKIKKNVKKGILTKQRKVENDIYITQENNIKYNCQVLIDYYKDHLGKLVYFVEYYKDNTKGYSCLFVDDFSNNLDPVS